MKRITRKLPWFCASTSNDLLRQVTQGHSSKQRQENSQNWKQMQGDDRTFLKPPIPGCPTAISNHVLCLTSTMFLATLFLQRTGQEGMGLGWEPWFSEGRRYCTFSFQFLQGLFRWPRPSLSPLIFWVPALPLNKKSKQPNLRLNF